MPTSSSRAVSIGAASEYENQTIGREASLPPRLECVDFTDCRFVGLEFRSVRLLSCRFFDCSFERVDASAADFTEAFDRALYQAGKDRYHGTAGLGVVPFPGFQLDFAGNYSKDVKEVSVSTVFRF